MILGFFISKSAMSPELLFYSWNDLKFNSKFFFNTDLDKKLLNPISKKWFYKTSLLIRSGKFVYQKKTSKNLSSLSNLKFKIIENAFLKLIEPCFKSLFFDPKLSLIEYLRNFSFNLLNLSKFFDIKYREFPSDIDCKTKNFFVKKVLSTNKLLQKKFDFYSYNTVHNSIKNMGTWDTDVDYFIKLDILRVFGNLNRNRLKNIFCKIIQETFFWQEIEKMINSNNINICSNDIYLTNDNNSFSFLSRFLLNLYLAELDIYVNSIISGFNNRLNIFFETSNIYLSGNSKSLLSEFIPLKLENLLSSKKSLKNINVLLYQTIESNFTRILPNSRTRFFVIKIFYTRFLHHGLIAIKSSLEFTRSFSNNLINFIRTNLHFDFTESLILSSIDKNLFFLGFNVRKKSFDFKSSSFLPLKKSFLTKLDFRLLRFKKKINSLFFDRFKLELSSHIFKILKTKNLSSSSYKESVLWTYLFQLESVRSSQMNNFIGSFDSISLLTNNIFSSLKVRTSSSTTYYKYSLKIYNTKLKFLLNEISSKTPSFINASLYPLDFKLISLVRDFEKNIFILNEKLTQQDLNFRRSDLSFVNASSSSFYTNLQNKVLFRLKNLYKKNFTKKDNFCRNSSLLVLVPTKFCFEKFRILGFVHPSKNRAWGNPNYLSFEDNYIIKSFGYLSFCIITWFRCTNNFTQAKLLVEVIRQSCFLTLCRKHNKGKSWVYSVYTPDLLLVRKFFGKRSFFPSRKLLSNLRKKYILGYNCFMNEKIFLID
uniref:Maturase n=1 Tax=Monomorphina parapyrum TaxID=1664066 RepID=A0A0G3VI43_9EUGL|nr:maturase [Monomorphina parapyrum]AKL78908.1 maturase [Monomorphina parapyrum]